MTSHIMNEIKHLKIFGRKKIKLLDKKVMSSKQQMFALVSEGSTGCSGRCKV